MRVTAQFDQQSATAKRQLDSSISEAVSSACTAVRDMSVTTVRQQLTEVISSGITIVIDDDQAKALTEELVAGLQSAFVKSIPDVVESVKTSVGKQMTDGFAPEIKNTVKSLQSLILHDVRGAIDGESKKMLEDLAKRVVDKAAHQADLSTKVFFDDKVKEFVDNVMSSIRESIQQALQELREQPDGMYLGLTGI